MINYANPWSVTKEEMEDERDASAEELQCLVEEPPLTFNGEFNPIPTPCGQEGSSELRNADTLQTLHKASTVSVGSFEAAHAGKHGPDHKLPCMRPMCARSRREAFS